MCHHQLLDSHLVIKSPKGTRGNAVNMNELFLIAVFILA